VGIVAMARKSTPSKSNFAPTTRQPR
jgi:hypothetical protein